MLFPYSIFYFFAKRFHSFLEIESCQRIIRILSTSAPSQIINGIILFISVYMIYLVFENIYIWNINHSNKSVSFKSLLNAFPTKAILQISFSMLMRS